MHLTQVLVSFILDALQLFVQLYRLSDSDRLTLLMIKVASALLQILDLLLFKLCPIISIHEFNTERALLHFDILFQV